MHHYEGCLALECVHQHLAILPSRVLPFLSQERLQQPFYLGGDLCYDTAGSFDDKD